MRIREMLCCLMFVASGELAVVNSLHAQPIASSPVLPLHSIPKPKLGELDVLSHAANAFDRAPQWSLAPAPVATAGGAHAPNHDLTNAWEVELLSDGRLVTLASIGNRLLLFAPDGKGGKSLGRQGKGPGEIMAPGGMSRTRGDTIIITDAANARINWIVVDKGFVITKPLPAMTNGSFVKPVGMLRGGELVLSTSGLVQNGAADGVTRPTAAVMVVAPTTGYTSTVASLPDLELMKVEMRYGGRQSFNTTVLGFSRSAMAVAWDTVVATGTGDGYRIDLRNSKGAVLSSIRVAVKRRPVTQAMRDSSIALGLRRFDDPGRERMVDPEESRRLERSKPFADSMPPYGQWFVSPNNTLWVVDAIAPGDIGGSATAFRQDGAILGRLRWTRPGTPVAFGNDRLVLREADDDGVISLGVYRIQPARR
ncbi:MAG: hypothetical protein V4617_06370 [Gemmatimonadota bacterium]